MVHEHEEGHHACQSKKNHSSTNGPCETREANGSGAVCGLAFSQVRGVSESGVPGDGISGVQSSERLCDEGGVNRIEPIGFLDSCGCERGGARVWPVPRDR